MFKDFDPQDFHWVLPVYRYKEPEQLLRTLGEAVIAPAEEKAKALEATAHVRGGTDQASIARQGCLIGQDQFG